MVSPSVTLETVQEKVAALAAERTLGPCSYHRKAALKSASRPKGGHGRTARTLSRWWWRADCCHSRIETTFRSDRDWCRRGLRMLPTMTANHGRTQTSGECRLAQRRRVAAMASREGRDPVEPGRQRACASRGGGAAMIADARNANGRSLQAAARRSSAATCASQITCTTRPSASTRSPSQASSSSLIR